MKAFVKDIAFYLPEVELANEQLSAEFAGWPVDKIMEKTGIYLRHIAREDECASDLGVKAALRLFKTGVCKPEDIDFVLFCTQSPDYFLPTTACLIQERLKIPNSAGSFDFNLGCSGFIYGLGISKGLIETNQATNVLLITAETYSKFIHPQDKSVRSIFGDAGAVTLIQGIDSAEGELIGPFVYGTDGSGAKNLIVPVGGMRRRWSLKNAVEHPDYMDESGNIRNETNLYMNGPEIFNFTLREIPKTVTEILERTGTTMETIDLFIFHQANKYMIDHLRKKMKIAEEKFYISLREYGNTVSCTIPIAMKNAFNEGKIGPGSLIALVGFGVGYSWGATVIKWV